MAIQLNPNYRTCNLSSKQKIVSLFINSEEISFTFSVDFY